MVNKTLLSRLVQGILNNFSDGQFPFLFWVKFTESRINGWMFARHWINSLRWWCSLSVMKYGLHLEEHYLCLLLLIVILSAIIWILESTTRQFWCKSKSDVYHCKNVEDGKRGLQPKDWLFIPKKRSHQQSKSRFLITSFTCQLVTWHFFINGFLNLTVSRDESHHESHTRGGHHESRNESVITCKVCCNKTLLTYWTM